jgi:hypothetical protein
LTKRILFFSGCDRVSFFVCHKINLEVVVVAPLGTTSTRAVCPVLSGSQNEGVFLLFKILTISMSDSAATAKMESQSYPHITRRRGPFTFKRKKVNPMS